MRNAFLLLLLSLSLFAKIIGSDFLTLEKDSLKITDETKFLSYVKSLDDGTLLLEYKNISKPINLLSVAEERLVSADSYEQAFKNLKLIDLKLYLKERPENIDSEIRDLKRKQSDIVALLFSIQNKRYYDIDVIPIIFEYRKLDRKILELEIQKESLLKSKEALIDAIVKKRLSFEGDDAPRAASLATEAKRKSDTLRGESIGAASDEKKEYLAIKAATFSVLAQKYEIKADFAEKIKLLKTIKTAKTSKGESKKLSILLLKKYEPSYCFEASSVNYEANKAAFEEYKQKREELALSQEESRLESERVERILSSFDDTISAKAGGVLEEAWALLEKLLKTTLFVSNNIDVNLKSVIIASLSLAFILFFKRWITRSVIPAYFERMSAEDAGRSAHIRFIVSKAANIAAYSLIFFVILGAFGLSLTNFAIIVSALSVGIGFGLQGVVSNFISGVILLFENSIKIGDLLRLSDGRVGRVTSVNLRTTNIRTFENVDILIPNSIVFAGQIENMTRESSIVRRDVKFTVGYNTDTIYLKEILDSKTKELMGGELLAATALLIYGYEKNGVVVEYRVMVDLKNHPFEVGDFLREFLSELIKNGIELPYPKLEIVKLERDLK